MDEELLDISPVDTEDFVPSDNVFFIQSFNIAQKHLDYILSVNDNKSVALRIIIDRCIREEHKRIIPVVDRCIFLMTFGFIVLMMSSLMDNWVRFSCVVFGVFLVCYGALGGVISAVQFSKKK